MTPRGSGRPAPAKPGHARGAARRRWLAVHRWIGLLAGVVLAVQALSGMLLVLKRPLMKWEVGAALVELQATAVPPPPAAAWADEAAWRDSARRAYPQLRRIAGAQGPNQGFLPSDNAMVFGAVEGRRGMGIAVLDPFTAEPRGFFHFDDLWLARIVALHRSLLLPPSLGGPVGAAFGALALLSLLSGLWLWWPRGGRWRQALRWRAASHGVRRLRNWHEVIAVWLSLPLLVLTVTGIWLSVPGWFAWAGNPRTLKPIFSALHGHLLLGTAGQVVVTLAGMVLTVLCVTGMLLWWRLRPNRRSGRRAPA